MNIRLRLAGDRRRSSRTALLACAVAVLFCAVSSPAAAATQATKAQQQEDVRKAAQETLARLYKLQPQARSAVERSAGYAVFSNFGMKIMVAAIVASFQYSTGRRLAKGWSCSRAIAPTLRS